MPRIVYLGFPSGGISGGQKVSLRHVEALRELRFDAVFWTNATSRPPTWLDHSAPVEVDTPLRDDDVLVLPEDAPNAIRQTAGMPQRVAVFCQNHFYMAALSFHAIAELRPDRFLGFLTSGRTIAASCARAFPDAAIRVVPAFADERLFRPAPVRVDAIAFVPRKRALEARAIRGMLERYHPRHRSLTWVAIEDMPERQVADVLGSSTLFLSLNRLEGLGMTLLEALAGGCVVAGFTGLGAREIADPTNGFWVEEDDCEAAADALARAADLVAAGGAPLAAHLASAREVAEQWTYAAFRSALETTWAELAPGARCGALSGDTVNLSGVLPHRRMLPSNPVSSGGN